MPAETICQGLRALSEHGISDLHLLKHINKTDAGHPIVVCFGSDDQAFLCQGGTVDRLKLVVSVSLIDACSTACLALPHRKSKRKTLLLVRASNKVQESYVCRKVIGCLLVLSNMLK